MPRPVPAAVLLLALLALAWPSTAAAHDERCNISGKERRLGATYVTRLTVHDVGCRSAERVVRAFHACRRSNGGADGRCRSRVRGYRCSDRRLRSSSTQFDARATCRRGDRKITHQYTQFT
jgi:hypothetical protein